MFKFLALNHVENVHLYPRAYGIEEGVAEEEGEVNQINSTSTQAQTETENSSTIEGNDINIMILSLI